LAFIWPFSFFFFGDLAFFETAYGQIFPFLLFGPGNPGAQAQAGIFPIRIWTA